MINANGTRVAFVTNASKATQGASSITQSFHPQGAFCLSSTILTSCSSSPHLYVLLDRLSPASVGWGSHRKGGGELPSRPGLFFFPDPCLISVFALLCLGLLLIKKRWNIKRICKGAADKEKHLFNIFSYMEGYKRKAILLQETLIKMVQYINAELENCRQYYSYSVELSLCWDCS